MFNHGLPTPFHIDRVPLSSGSVARWSRLSGPKKCVVFVHGFRGRAVSTWGDFIEIAVKDPHYDHVDLIFLGYDSASQSASFSAGVISDAISALGNRPASLIELLGGPVRASNFDYSEIILVGHSLGGAIVRDVAMSAKVAGEAWADKASLALFAPAHHGANIVSLLYLASEGFAKLLGPVKAILYYKSPVIQDLIRGSIYLQALSQRAQQLAGDRTSIARLVVHGASDRIVIDNVFHQDPQCTPYAGHDHFSVCKPTPHFIDPVIDVGGIL